MKTEDLIVELARDATPVRPLHRPIVRLAIWLVVAVACMAAGILVYGVRDDHATMVATPGFVTDFTLAAAILLLGAGAALVLAVPGAGRQGLLRWLAAAAVLAWCGLVLAAVVVQGHGLSGAAHWRACAARVFSIGVLPGAGLLVLLHRGAVLHPAWAAGLAVAAAMSGGALAVQLTCPLSDPGHILLGHVAPVAVLGLTTALAATMRARPSRA